MGSNLLSLLDDIAALMDDVSIMTKTALHKTSGILTDDLAVNIGQVDGVTPSQEIPTVIKIFLGSLVNKVIIIPFVLLLTAYSPITLKYILLLGGLYLSYEGAHKVWEKLFHKKKTQKVKASEYLDTKQVKTRVFGAIKTDFVLSIEILVIAQSTLSGSITNQAISLGIIGLVVSLLIYGIVALLVKIDDLGLVLIKKSYVSIGEFLVNSMPKMMKLLSFVGVVAMLLVGGEIISHHFHFATYIISHVQYIVTGLVFGLLVLSLFGVKSLILSKNS